MSRIIAVAGGTCSGKSTLCKHLTQALGDRCTHIHFDDYYRSVPREVDLTKHTYNFDEPAALDTPNLLKNILDLKSGRSVDGPTYDFTTHLRRSETKQLEPRQIILVEGILCLWDEKLRALYDHQIFVNAPDDIRFQRRLRRDVSERGRSKSSVEKQWRATVQPMHVKYVLPTRNYAELTLNGTENIQSLLKQVFDLIEAP